MATGQETMYHLENCLPLPLRHLYNDAAVDFHVAVMAEPFLSLLLEGQKTIESRFSTHKIAPYHRIKTGDVVLTKAIAGPIVGAFRAGAVHFIMLNGAQLRRIRDQYSRALCADDAFWTMQEAKRYATLIEVRRPQRITSVKIDKKNRLGWMRISSGR